MGSISDLLKSILGAASSGWDDIFAGLGSLGSSDGTGTPE